jgi:uncharacterized protein HemY
MTELLELYEFTEEERNTIMWWIAIVKDLIKLNNKYETEELIPESLKCHWKKTVVKI